MVIKLLAKNDLLDSKDWLKNTSHRQAFICANSITLLKRLRKDRQIFAQNAVTTL